MCITEYYGVAILIKLGTQNSGIKCRTSRRLFLKGSLRVTCTSICLSFTTTDQFIASLIDSKKLLPNNAIENVQFIRQKIHVYYPYTQF